MNVKIDFKGLDQLMKQLGKLPEAVQEDAYKKVVVPAAVQIKERMQSHIRDSKEPHKRYKAGKVIATYEPGNLRRSIKIRRRKRDGKTMIGPTALKKGKANGTYSGRRVDAYYASFVNNGTRFMKNNPSKGYAEKTYDWAKSNVRPKLLKDLGDYIVNYKNTAK
jgi:HK97 gp10 family phage protein